MTKLLKFLFAIYILFILIILCATPVVITGLLGVFVNELFFITFIITMPLSVGFYVMLANGQWADWIEDWIKGIFEVKGE